MISRSGQKHRFYVELAKLLAAGFGIREAAAVLRETKLPPFQLKLLIALEKGLDRGMTIAAAYSQVGLDVFDIEKSILMAGEKGGRLTAAFQHLAEYFGMLADAHHHFLKGVLYPVLILHLGIFISVIPGAVLNGSEGMWGRLLLMLISTYATGVAVFFAARYLQKLSLQKEGVDAFINRIPLIGRARKNLAMARFTKVYHICLLAGFTVSESIAQAASAAHSGSISAAGKRLSQRAFQGDLLGPVVVSEKAFPQAFAGSYATAEIAGSLDKDMERWGALYQQQAEESIRTMSLMLPKIAGTLVMLFVAWKIVGFWSDYYGRLDSFTE